MRNYYESLKKDVFDFLPITFHIKDGKKDEEYYTFDLKFLESTKSSHTTK